VTQLEEQVPTFEEQIAAMSPEERRQRLLEIIETAKAAGQRLTRHWPAAIPSACAGHAKRNAS